MEVTLQKKTVLVKRKIFTELLQLNRIFSTLPHRIYTANMWNSWSSAQITKAEVKEWKYILSVKYLY